MLNAFFLMSRCWGVRDVHQTVPPNWDLARAEDAPGPAPPQTDPPNTGTLLQPPRTTLLGNYILKTLTNAKLGERHVHLELGTARPTWHVSTAALEPQTPSGNRAKRGPGRG